MKTEFLNEKISKIVCNEFTVPFMEDKYGFFVEKDDVKTNIDLTKTDDAFVG